MSRHSRRLIAPSLRKGTGKPYETGTPYLFTEEKFEAGKKVGALKSMLSNPVAIGAMSGAYFGPAGAFVGGALARRQKSKAKRAQGASYRKATEAAFPAAREIRGAFDQAKGQIEKSFQSNTSARRARYAASGADVSGTGWLNQMGQESVLRNKAYKGLDAEYEKYKKSSVGARVREAYYRLGGMTGGYLREDMDQEAFDRAEKGTAFQVDDMSKTSMWNPGQYKKVNDTLRMIEKANQEEEMGMGGSTTSTAGKNRMTAYLNRVNPTFEQYESRTFGTAEDRRIYDREANKRIADAGRAFNVSSAQTRLASNGGRLAEIEARRKSGEERNDF